jgi:GNAT superfamily N-acetyltransferase
MARRPSTATCTWFGSDAMHVRTAVATDRVTMGRQLLKLVPFGLPPWRDPRKALAIELQAIDQNLSLLCPRTALMVAESESGSLLGFIRAIAAWDRLIGGRHAQIAGVLVLKGAPADAVARVLVEAIRGWALSQGCNAVLFAASWVACSDRRAVPLSQTALFPIPSIAKPMR